MKHLENILYDLLLQHNCVIIPRLGGFVTNYITAKVDVKSGVIYPPKKAINFNKQLTANDGIIAHYISQRNSISFEEAQKILQREALQVKKELDNGNRVSFQNVGFLFISKSGKIEFEQDRFFNLLLSSYGLGNVHFIAETVTESKEDIYIDNSDVQVTNHDNQATKSASLKSTLDNKEEENNGEQNAASQVKEITHPALENNSSFSLFKKIVKYAAVAAVIPICFYGFWLPMKTDVLQSGMLYWGDFNPFKKKISAVYSPQQSDKSITINFIQKQSSSVIKQMENSSSSFSYPIDENEFIRVLPNATTQSRKSNHSVTQKGMQYYAIVGCFRNKNNATNLISELKSKGYDAFEVDVENGLHRVAAGSSSNPKVIVTLRNKLEQNNLPSWVLKQ